MTGILKFDARVHDFRGHRLDLTLAFQADIGCCMCINKLHDRPSAHFIRVLSTLIPQHIRGDQLKLFLLDLVLNMQLGLCLQRYLNLRLIVIGAIIVAHVKIHTQADHLPAYKKYTTCSGKIKALILCQNISANNKAGGTSEATTPGFLPLC